MERKGRIDHYETHETLGVGGFGKVKRALDTFTQTEVALKIMQIINADKNDPDKIQRSRDRFLRLQRAEVEALNSISHPNVMRILKFSEDSVFHRKNGSSYSTPYIAMELMRNGDLLDVLFYSGPFEEELARVYFRQLLEALRACHATGISHRDIKPENLLFDAEFNLKLTDFGYAKLSETELLNTKLGTASYMAPEILMNQPYSGVAVDLFACGLILFILLIGHPALKSQATQSDDLYRLLLTDPNRFWEAHLGEHYNLRFSHNFRTLIQNMLAFNPNDRPSLQMVLEDPWVNGPAHSLEEAHLRMETMYQNAFQRKIATKEAEKAKKRQSAAIRGRAYKDDVGGNSESESSESSMVSSPNLKRLTPFLSGTEKFSRIFTSLPAEQVQMRLHVLFEALRAEVLEESPTKFKSFVKMQNDILCSVELFDVGNGTICVDLAKTEGSRWEFIQEFNRLNERFQKAREDGE